MSNKYEYIVNTSKDFITIIIPGTEVEQASHP